MYTKDKWTCNLISWFYVPSPEPKSYFCIAAVLGKSCFASPQSENNSGSDEKLYFLALEMIGFKPIHTFLLLKKNMDGMICIIILRLFKLEVSSATKTLPMHTACSKIQMNTSGGNFISKIHVYTCWWRTVMIKGLETPPGGQGSAFFGTHLHIVHSSPLLWHSYSHGTTYTLKQNWESEEPSEWMCYSVNLSPCFLLVISVVTGFDFCTFTDYSLTCFYHCSDLLHLLLAVPICFGRVVPNFMWHFSFSWSNTWNFQRREKSKRFPSNKVKPQRENLYTNWSL